VSPLSSQTKTSGPSLVVRIAIILAMLASLRYFLWRFTDTMNPALVWFFYIFLAAELVGFGEVMLFYLTTWRRRRHDPAPALPDRSVDLFIPTYNEPVALLRDTVVCAVSVRYPHTTWLLDDGNRPEVKALAEELGCRYLARTERTHAKAGNLNHALKHSTGDFVVTLDADHVPQPELIDRMLGFFENPRVAIVQVNQDFYNLDSFQHATNWEDRAAWQQQELFFNVIQPGKDALGAAMYCGSPAMLRRKALEEIGGFATETVTEDMHTGLRLQKRG
jgi:cellulose synthase (UDP-forming)